MQHFQPITRVSCIPRITDAWDFSLMMGLHSLYDKRIKAMYSNDL